jgi:hypothetical protein
VVVKEKEANKKPDKTVAKNSDRIAVRGLDQITGSAIDRTEGKDGVKIVEIVVEIGIGVTAETEEVMTRTIGSNTALGAGKNIETDVTSTTGKGPTDVTEIETRETLEVGMIVETKGGGSAPGMREPSLQKERRRGLELRR